MNLNLSVDELLSTTRSVRKRLDFERPVSRDVIMDCLELALQAPTGSNAQGWQWVFVEDPLKKKALADIYRANATIYLDRPKPQRGDVRDQQIGAVVSSAKYLSEHFEEAPVLFLYGGIDFFGTSKRVKNFAPRGDGRYFWYGVSLEK